jgi:tRNA nucleotidyltransferase/poly(A) polymerase
MKVIKGVYCLTSPSGKRYVGVGCGKQGVFARWRMYKSYLCKNQTALYNALISHGSDNFKYEVILETDDVEKAKRVEIQLIALWNLTNPHYGYNISIGGDCGMLGKKFSEDHKRKISESNKGHKHSEETKKLISKNYKKREQSEEQRKKTSERMIGNKYGLGHKHSEDHKRKIGESQKGERHYLFGKHHSEESKRKMSESHTIIRKVLDTITGQIYEGSMKQIGEELKLNVMSFCRCLFDSGKYKNYKLI